MPTYNRAQLIGKAITSVIEQTYEHWELIIVDDGSTDSTREVVEGFLDARICYFSKNHEERSAARNFGMDKARGNYICFLDSDDYFIKDHLQVHYEYLKQKGYPEIVLYSGTYVESDQELKKYPHLMESKNLVLSLWKTGYNLLPFSFHQNLLTAIRFDVRLNYLEDLDFLLGVYDERKWFFLEDYTNVVVNHDSRSIITRFTQYILDNGKQHLAAIDILVTKHGKLFREKLSGQQFHSKRRGIIKNFIFASIKQLDIRAFIYFSVKYVRSIAIR
jgi:glycosyltransferase involved in cell wall biosynthesis